MTELRERLERAAARLDEKQAGENLYSSERTRLLGKIEGVKLALSYVSDEDRVAVPQQPTLAITPSIVQWFDTAYRAMLHEQSKPLAERDPLPAVRIYAQCQILGAMLRATGTQGAPDDEPAVILSALRDLLGMRDGQSFAQED